MAISERVATLEEFLKLSEAEPALEFWDGSVTQKVSPKAYHGRLQGKLVEWLNQAAEPLGLGMAYSETRFTTGGVSFVPDVSFYTRERTRTLPNRRIEPDFTQAPDIAIEIVSPGQSVTELVRKCLSYLAHGVRIALLVDADDESVLLFRPGQPPLALRGTDRLDLGEILPGFEVTVAELFATLIPPWEQPADPSPE